MSCPFYANSAAGTQPGEGEPCAEVAELAEPEREVVRHGSPDAGHAEYVALRAPIDQALSPLHTPTAHILLYLSDRRPGLLASLPAATPWDRLDVPAGRASSDVRSTDRPRRELLYTTSETILGKKKFPLFRPTGPIYQTIDAGRRVPTFQKHATHPDQQSDEQSRGSITGSAPRTRRAHRSSALCLLSSRPRARLAWRFSSRCSASSVRRCVVSRETPEQTPERDVCPRFHSDHRA